VRHLVWYNGNSVMDKDQSFDAEFVARLVVLKMEMDEWLARLAELIEDVTHDHNVNVTYTDVLDWETE